MYSNSLFSFNALYIKPKEWITNRTKQIVHKIFVYALYAIIKSTIQQKP